MGQNIVLQGQTYADVPAVALKTSDNLVALFTDVSDTTAIAADVTSGKYFYNAGGARTLGTRVDQGVSVVTASDSAGGDVVTITGMVVKPLNPWLMRPDAELVKRVSYDKMINEDEGVTIPAYTTTSTTLKASETLSTTVPVDYSNYNYRVAIRCLTIPGYSVTTKGKGRVEYTFAAALYELVEYPVDTISALIDPSKKIAAVSYSMFSAGNNVGIVYYSTSTALARQASAAYGPAQTVTAPTASASAITLKTPALIVRGHTTYFTSTYFNAVTDIRYQYVMEVYRVPKNNLSFNGWGLYNMSLQCVECANSSAHILT